jgi:hypothetical protein
VITSFGTNVPYLLSTARIGPSKSSRVRETERNIAFGSDFEMHRTTHTINE